MITQIYGLRTVADAVGCLEAGSDYLGLCAGVRDTVPWAVDFETARAIFTAIGDRAVKLMILFGCDEGEMVEVANDLRPDILHLSGGKFTSEAFYHKLHRGAPGVKLMQGVAMTGPEAYDYAVANQRFADYYILDSVRPNGAMGAAGVTHDWSISRRIVQDVAIPVVLAGGLGPDNVAAAIEAVRPFGVDTLTKTNLFENGVPVRKDLDAVREFNRIAHQYD